MATLPISLPATPYVLELGDATYPTSDGRPMGETDLHRRVMVDLIAVLEQFYAGQKVYVSGNLLLFYEPGNKRRHVSPDVLITKGLQPGPRKNYILWQEGLPPNVVIEVTSESTRNEDLKKKFEIYRDVMRVAEYFLFDPYAEFLTPPLQGFRLESGRYIPIAPTGGRLLSAQLDLELEARGESLRLFDRRTGEVLLTPTEMHERDAEEIYRLRAELERQRQR